MKKPQKNKCIYCGASTSTHRGHHIPAAAFYSDPKPNSLIVVPCCGSCKAQVRDDEEWFRKTLLMRLGQESENEKIKKLEFKARLSLQRKDAAEFKKEFLRSIVNCDIFTSSGLYIGRHRVVKLDYAKIGRVIDKAVRGLYWKEFHKKLPTNSRVVWCYLEELDNADIEEIAKQCEFLDKGVTIDKDVFSYRYSSCQIGKRDSITNWLLTFYSKIQFYCFSGDSDDLRECKIPADSNGRIFTRHEARGDLRVITGTRMIEVEENLPSN